MACFDGMAQIWSNYIAEILGPILLIWFNFNLNMDI